MAKREPRPQAPDVIRNGHGPESRAWLIEKLQQPFYRDDRTVRTLAHAERLADRMLRKGFGAEAVFHRAQEHAFLIAESGYGWMTREGEYLGCTYAGHDRLLQVLGVATRGAERMGWARISGEKVQSRYYLSPQQVRALGERGISSSSRDDGTKARWSPLDAHERVELDMAAVREQLPYSALLLYEVIETDGTSIIEVRRIVDCEDSGCDPIIDQIRAVAVRHGVELRTADDADPGVTPRA